MLVVNVSLMLCWIWICVALYVPQRQQLIQDQDTTMTGSHHVHHAAPCFVDDILSALHEGVGTDGELTNSSLTLFGICASSDNTTASVLLELAKETSRKRILYPTGVLVEEEGDTGMLVLTFDLHHSPLLSLSSVLFLAFERSFEGGELNATFTSHSLQPDTQSVCISGETRYVLLTGKASESIINHKRRISVETKSPEMSRSLKDVFIGGKSGSNINVTPLLLFAEETGTDTRRTRVSAAQTFSFLCELKRFLGDVLHQDHPQSPPFQLDSLQSLPPLSLGLSSTENLLAGLINSSSPTVFSFSRGFVSRVNHGTLAMSPALLEELRQRLEQIGLQIMEMIREEEVDPRAIKRLEKLKRLSVLPKNEPVAGENQYRAFLLLKALQTVAHEYELQLRQRPIRDSNNPTKNDLCGLRSLTVSLERHLIGPNSANINKCSGSCSFPLTNTNNHAILVRSHTESVIGDNWAPCCVPVAYEALEVVDVNEQGTFLSIKSDAIAIECGCR